MGTLIIPILGRKNQRLTEVKSMWSSSRVSQMAPESTTKEDAQERGKVFQIL